MNTMPWVHVLQNGGQSLPLVMGFPAIPVSVLMHMPWPDMLHLPKNQAMVPIVEPEVLMDGEHSLDTCYQVTAKVLDVLFSELINQKVGLNGIILKPNMVISGTDANNRADVAMVASATVDCLISHVPSEVPGIAFLSGGQTSEEATAHLSAMNEFGPHPWQLSFSYGRALQASPLRVWGGNKNNLESAQAELLKRSRLNGLARTGNYNPQMESV